MPMILWSYSRRRRPTGRAIAVAALALLLFAVLLNLPVEPLSVGLGDVAWMPLELAVAVLALAILRPLRRARWLPPLVAVAMLLVVGLELAEAAARTALGRPVNLYLDIHLVPSIVDLLRGWLGDAAATGALLAVAVALVVLFVLSA